MLVCKRARQEFYYMVIRRSLDYRDLRYSLLIFFSVQEFPLLLSFESCCEYFMATKETIFSIA